MMGGGLREHLNRQRFWYSDPGPAEPRPKGPTYRKHSGHSPGVGAVRSPGLCSEPLVVICDAVPPVPKG